MRGQLLLAIVLGMATTGLFNPQIALLAYVCFGLLRPDYLAFSAGAFAYSTYLGTALIVGSWRLLLNESFRAWFLNPLVWLLLLLQIPIYFSTLDALFPEYSQALYARFARMCIICLWIPLIVNSVTRMKQLILVCVASLGYHAVVQAIIGAIKGGAAFRYGIGGFMSDNNTFAAGLVMILPFCWLGRKVVTSKWTKLALAVASFCCLATIMISHSRGAALAACAVAALLVSFSKKKFTAILGLAVATVPALVLVSGTYFDRLNTIAGYEQDNSAMSRIIHNGVAWELALQNPGTGVGFGEENYFRSSQPLLPEENARLSRLVVHNSFLQILVHSGFGALFFFMLLFGGAVWLMYCSSRRLSPLNTGLEVYPQMLLTSLVGYGVASLTQPRSTFDFAYQVAMFCAAWYGIERKVLADHFQVAEVEALEGEFRGAMDGTQETLPVVEP